MKKILLALLLLVFSFQTFSQAEKKPARSKEYYLQKSKNKKTAAWILLGGGTAMIVGGTISQPKVKPSGFDAYNFNASDIITLIGIGVDIVSIPFFISAHTNKIRASVAIANQKFLWYQKNSVGFVTQPSVTIKIGL